MSHEFWTCNWNIFILWTQATLMSCDTFYEKHKIYAKKITVQRGMYFFCKTSLYCSYSQARWPICIKVGTNIPRRQTAWRHWSCNWTTHESWHVASLDSWFFLLLVIYCFCFKMVACRRHRVRTRVDRLFRLSSLVSCCPNNVRVKLS